MEKIPKAIRKRMPPDLLQYILMQKTTDDIPVCERDPANVAFEVYQAGSFKMIAYFPPSHSSNTVVFMHLPGGICKNGINRDRSWCSNMAAESQSIYICVDYPSAFEVSFQNILTDCEWAYGLVRRMCRGQWKERWDTDPTRIVLSGSSIGGTLAMSVAATAAQEGKPAYGLIGIVPVIVTDPDPAEDPWGENESTLGLTPDRLLRDLKTAFGGKYRDFRHDWHSNPCKMPDEILRSLPRMIMVFAKLDILYDSQLKFAQRLEEQGVGVDWLEVDGLHNVKDMAKATEAGRTVEKFVAGKSAGFVQDARKSAGL